jgi:CMP-N-acetylneuraminic acid synthetase
MLHNRKYNVLVPCRKGSQRIKLKNTKQFAGVSGGLLSIKLTQLDKSEFVDTILVSSDDDMVLDIADKFSKTSRKRFEIIERPKEFAIASRLDEFVRHVSQIMPDGVCIWTHVTSPFFDAEAIDNLISAYHEKVVEGVHDSLFTVTKEQTFTWDENGNCISHDRCVDKWPQTQDLSPLFFANSAAFVIEKNSMQELNDRIGAKPFLYEIGKLQGLDIDWPDDFVLAEQIFQARGGA